MNHKSANRESANRESANRESANRESANRKSANRESANRKSAGINPLQRADHNYDQHSLKVNRQSLLFCLVTKM